MVKVKLLDYTRNGPKLVYDYLKYLSYPEDLEKKLGKPPNVEEMMELIIDRGYTTVLEHINFTFLIEDMSMTVSREFLEHRLASHLGKSSRGFMKDWKFSYTIPERISKAGVKNAFVEAMSAADETYGKLTVAGIKRDDARLVLPLATHCSYLWTINANSLVNFLGLRLCPRSYIEIQQMAEQVYKQCLGVMPELFKFVGCRGVNMRLCPEGAARNSKSVPCPYKDEMSDVFIPTREDVGKLIPSRRRWIPVKWK